MDPCKCFVVVAVAVISACGSGYTANGAAVEQSMIIGGNRIDITQAPFTVQIFEDRGNGKVLDCGGSVIGKVHVLTAAHCVQSGAAKLTVVYSSNILSRANIRQRGVKQVHTHPKFKNSGLKSLQNHGWDVAVLLVDKTIPVNPIKIAPSSVKHIPEGKRLTTVGWGKTRVTATVGVLHLFSSTFIVLAHWRCKEKLTFGFHNLEQSEFCVVETTGHAVCNGDSGGPVYDSKTNTQYGVVSWGACGRNGIGVMTDLTEPTISTFLKPFLPRVNG